MFHPEVELDASFYFAGSGEGTGVASRRRGGEGWHGAGRVRVETVLAVPRPVPDVEAQPTCQEETQRPRFATRAYPLAPQVGG